RRRGQNSSHTSPDVVEAVRALTTICADKYIAGFLNRNNLRTGRGNRWTQERVTSLRSKRKISKYSIERQEAEGWMNLTQASAYVSVSLKTLRLAVERGKVEAMHPLPDGPWIFKREHLDSPRVREVIKHIHQRRMHPVGHTPGELSLFK
ncbi:recombinase family protein, partial [bacterium]|nr:recombinase family protein [bacterium]